ncbi:hypothetical protein V1264_001866 [Littorina saxatilis]|uniref:Arrestin C-terminal-like domain-containing protein n=2 Tax=Littorina saxatilis TaxID=31220 RepID=A0AAN9C2F0_9CAEN
MQQLEIIFDNNPTGVYEPGQVVQGSILLNLTKQLEFRGIRAKFKGKAKVEWEEGGGDNRKTYYASEDYFGEEHLLHGKFPKDTSDKIALPPGEHFFPFRFQLPPDIPASYEANYGKVKYSVKAVVDKPLAFDITEKRSFTVTRQLDLNQVSDAMREARTTEETTLCCCCCATGPLSGTILVPRKGCLVGETVKVFGEIENTTTRAIEVSYITFKSKLTYITKSRRKEKTEDLARIQGPSIPPGGSHQFNGETFTIPRGIMPSFLQGCSIMDIDYIVKLKAVPSGLSGNLEVPLEIVVGTIPHRQTQEMGEGGGREVTTAARGFSSDFPTGPPMSSFSSATAPVAPPPSYGAVMGTTDSYGVFSGPSGQQYGVPQSSYGLSSGLFQQPPGAPQAGFLDFSPAFDYGEKEQK